MSKPKLTPTQIVDQVMELDSIPASLQTSIYALVKSIDGTMTQNKFFLMLCMAFMTEFDKESSSDVLEGKSKVAISKSTLEEISAKIKLMADSARKPMLCYNEEGDEGFIRIEWKKADER